MELPREGEVLPPPTFDNERPERCVRISAHTSIEAIESLVELSKEFAYLFAWSAREMSWVKPEVAMRCLSVGKGVCPVQQKRRPLSEEKEEALRKEVGKLLDVGFVEEARYTTWLSNAVLVPKESGHWRMCIDKLVDATANHEALIFLDMFSGYHQILMCEEDREKTMFMTPFGNFHYKVMSFGLKNAGATYQHMVNTVFQRQTGRNMEAYVDDLVVKRKRRDDHLNDLRETFETMRAHSLRLNPLKCVFGVDTGKFLGFMITKRGIESNPKQVEAIGLLEPPRAPKEVQSLNGLLAALGRFIPRSADRGAPFFRVLKRVARFKWTEECDEAFEQLKNMLVAPTVMTAPWAGEVLYLYIVVSRTAVSAVLVSRVTTDGEERHVYYVNKVMTGPETRYAPIEKAALAVVAAEEKLRPYFQAHAGVVLTNLPLKSTLGSMDVAGRMVK
ncbi:unnamed protein product [Linum trigynum]|uniref:Reverse transcriptase domain-containing protein n=1 Tax=Linum trigynum TaxID=586398 RepID=A0AAV2G8A3_9ROSI